MGAFSKVTKLVRDVWNQGPERPEALRETEEESAENDEPQQSLESGFENLLPDVQVSELYMQVSM